MRSNSRKQDRRMPRMAFMRYWRWTVAVSGAALMVAVAVTLILPRVFVSEARLLAQIDGGGNSSSGEIDIRDAVAAIAQGLNSRPMHERLLKSLNSPGLGDVDVRASLDGEIIRVEGRASSPERAQQIAARLAELSLEEFRGFPIAPKSAAKSADVDPPPADRDIERLKREIAGAESKLQAEQTELDAAESRITMLRQQVARQAEPVAAPPPAESASDLRTKLRQLEARERELATTHSDIHPLLRAVRQQLADLQAVVSDDPASNSGTAAPAPPSPQATQRDLASEVSRAQSLRDRRESLSTLATRLRSELAHLIGQQTPAVPAAAPSPTRTLSLTLVQPASQPAELTAARRGFGLALGLLVAIAGGWGSALLAARSRPVLATASDLERMLDVPLVGVLPARTEASSSPA